MMVHYGSSGAAKAPMASVHASSTRAAADYGAVVVRNSGIFRSPAARVVLAVSTAALIMVALLSAARYNERASNLKELSDTVLDLTQKLQTLSKENEIKEHEIETLEKEFEGAEIELSWESQKQHDAHETMIQMYNSMSKQIAQSQENLIETGIITSQNGYENYQMKGKLVTEHGENAELKVALARVLKELSAVRAELPPDDRGGENKDATKGIPGGMDMDTKVRERKLRGAKPYQPGDSVEIIEEQEGGKLALRPGIITEINADGTYNVVKLEESIVLRNLKSNQFQTYHIYPEGTRALFEHKQDVYLPITIVRFMFDSARSGSELHGKYACTRDDDANATKEVMLVNAMRIHRLAEPGETAGSDSLLSSET